MMFVQKAIVNVLLMVLPAAVSPIPPPWELVTEPGDSVEAQIDHSVVHSGASSARLQVIKSAGHEVALLYPFRAEAWQGKRVLLTGWVRSDLAGGEAGLAIMTNNGGRNSFFSLTEQHVSKQSAWQKLSVLCDVPKDATLMGIGMWVRHGNGSAWVDDLTFAAADSGAGKPPEPRKSPLLTHDEMSRIAETYKTAGAAPSTLGFE